ncbi:MAG: hypothetical protein KUG75_03170 [Pseudomonadales bacterium]|nr:hypothetical protein [Pseudomonadales bacterium]
MLKLIKLTVFAMGISLFSYSSLAAPVLTGSPDNYNGLNNLEVGGLGTFNIGIGDGDCASLFSGCNGAEDFTLTSLIEAEAVAGAIADAFAATGQFPEIEPDEFAGCTLTDVCQILIPYWNSIANSGVGAAQAIIASFGTGEGVSNWILSVDTSVDNGVTFGVVSQVPLPGALVLLLSGVLGLGLTGRKRKQYQAAA